MIETPENSFLNLQSPFSVADTLERLLQVLEEAGMTIFERIDHQANAQTVSVTMRPTVLVIFGNPQVGTPLMQQYPSVAIDLPLKALVWQDAEERVWLSANSPEYLQWRHGMTQTPFQVLPGLLARVLEPSPTSN